MTISNALTGRAPRCQFHVAVDMVPIEEAKPKYHRVPIKGHGGARTAEMSDEDWDAMPKRTLWRCPVVIAASDGTTVRCPCVSQMIHGDGVAPVRVASVEIVSAAPKCPDCGQPAVWFPYKQRSLCRPCHNKMRREAQRQYQRQYRLKRRASRKESAKQGWERRRAEGRAEGFHRKRIVAAAVLFAAFCVLPSAFAQSKGAKILSPFKFVAKTVAHTATNFVTWRDPARNLVYLGYAAAIALDLHSTSYFVARCPSCIEMTNPLIGRRPSNRALALDGAGEFLFTTTLSTSILENRHIPKPFKFIPYAALGTFAIGHIDAAHGNYQLPKLHATPVTPQEPAR